MNCVAGPSKVALRKPAHALRHVSSAAKYAAFLPQTDPDAKVDRTPQRILAAAAKGASPQWGWHQSPYGKLTEKQRIERNVMRGEQYGRHPEIAEFAENEQPVDHYDGSLDDAFAHSVKIGSVVEVRRMNRTFIGCVIGHALSKGRLMICTLTMYGPMLSHLVEDIFFTLPGYFPEELAGSCGAVSFPQNKIQEHARIAVVHRLIELTKDVEKAAARIRGRAQHLYSTFRPKDPYAYGELSTVDAARFIDSTRPDGAPATRTIFAAHQYLFQNNTHFIIDPVQHRVTQNYSIRPAHDVEALETVKDWVMHDHPAISDFVAKATDLIKTSRATRRLTGPIERVQNDPPLPQFTESDRAIIRVLNLFGERQRFIQEDPSEISVHYIVKQTGFINAVTPRDNVFRFLREIGVHTPWKDVTENKTVISQPTPEEQAAFDENGKRLLERGLQAQASSGPIGPEDFYPTDTCASIRHDFGDLPVFTIDPEGAEEIDDGLSLEKIPGSNDVWAHVHIADPTRLLHPEHVLSKAASKIGQTIYHPHTTVPMLPRAITDAGMSLTPGGPRHTITFSARVDEQGKLSDIMIRPGIIHNIQRMTYEELGHMLGLPRMENTKLLDLLSSDPRATDPSDDELAHALKRFDGTVVSRETLQPFHDTFKRILQRRLSRDFFSISGAVATPTLLEKNLPRNPDEPYAPTFWSGFPRVNLRYTPDDLEPVAMVGEFMLLASAVAARWCMERGVPIIRRGSESPIAPNPTCVADALAARDRYGHISVPKLFSLGIIPVRAREVVEPMKHFSLGFSAMEGGYTRVSSPLRRYGDMVNHWMIKAALLDPSLKSLPYTTEQLRLMALELGERTRAQLKRDYASGNLWTHRQFEQALNTDAFPEARDIMKTSIPATVVNEGTVKHRVGAMIDVFLPTLGVPAMLVTGSGSKYDPEDEIDVQVVGCTIETRSRLLVKTNS